MHPADMHGQDRDCASYQIAIIALHPYVLLASLHAYIRGVLPSCWANTGMLAGALPPCSLICLYYPTHASWTLHLLPLCGGGIRLKTLPVYRCGGNHCFALVITELCSDTAAPIKVSE